MVEFVEASEADPVTMTVGDVEVQGVYEVSEKGEGITEEYKAERESESGGEDTVDEPPAATLDIRAYCSDATWGSLDALRHQRSPFPVSIGPFVFDGMGITNLSKSVEGKYPEANDVSITLQEFRELSIQRPSSGETDSQPREGGDVRLGEAADPQWGPGSEEGVAPETETVTIASGERRQFGVSAGETFGRRVIDATANNANFVVPSRGGGFTVQDVGVAGPSGTTQPDTHFSFYNDNGNTALIRNLYLGDGAPSYTGDKGQTALWVAPSSQGAVRFGYINVQAFPDNGIYASAPAASAEVRMEHSFAHNNGHANFRLGRGMVDNVVSTYDSNFSHRGPRAVWARQPGVVNIEDTQIQAAVGPAIQSGAHDGGGVVNVTGESNVEGPLKRVNGGTISFASGASQSGADPTAYPAEVPGNPADAGNGF